VKEMFTLRRKPKLLHRLLESREYLAREEMARRIPGAFAITIGGIKVPQNFHEVRLMVGTNSEGV